MLVKHIKNIDIEDEFIKVGKDDSVLKVAKGFLSDKSCESGELVCSPILTAYVIEKGKPIGEISEDDLIEEIIIKGKDPQKTLAKDIMKPPICCSIYDEIRDVVNKIIDQGLLTIAACDGDQLTNVISVYDAIFLNQTLDEYETSEEKE